MKLEAVAFDLDGTLAVSKEPLSESMGVVLSELLNTMPVALLSGASFDQFKTQFLSRFPSDTQLNNLYLFPENAGQCFLYETNVWKSHYDYSFTDAEATHIETVLKGALPEAHLPPATTLWGEQIENRGAQISFSPLGQHAPVKAKEEWHTRHDSVRAKLRDSLQAQLPGFYVVSGGLTTIDITRKGITKAFGLQEFSKLTSIPVSSMLYIGDALSKGGNDAIVIETGIHTRQTEGPEETAKIIAELVNNSTDF